MVVGQQLLVTLQILGDAGTVGIGAFKRRRGAFDQRAFELKLAVDAADGGPTGFHRRLGLGQLGGIIGIADGDEYVAGLDQLVFGSPNFADIAFDLRADHRNVGFDISIVGGFHEASCRPPVVTEHSGASQNRHADGTHQDLLHSQPHPVSPPP
jgi:hypothetical protein